MQISGIVRFALGEDKIENQTAFLDKGKHLREKFGKDNKIHQNIVLSTWKYLVRGFPIEQQQLSALQFYLDTIVHDMDRFSSAHVGKFDIIMRVFGKMHEPTVRTDIHKLILTEHLVAVHGKICGAGV
jgi:hypothetical protein